MWPSKAKAAAYSEPTMHDQPGEMVCNLVEEDRRGYLLGVFLEYL